MLGRIVFARALRWQTGKAVRNFHSTARRPYFATRSPYFKALGLLLPASFLLYGHVYAESEASGPVQLSEEDNTDIDPISEDDLTNEGPRAYDPETGEINWDCPCLGGMAHGPCGEEFKAAFSCFVYSTADPKGMDCLEKFQGMQDCFRRHPDVYKEQLEMDESPEADADAVTEVATVTEAQTAELGDFSESQ